MAPPVCPLCRGFGKVHPVKSGRVDYSSTVFCACQGERALRVAHPRVLHPDFAQKSFYDSHDKQRQARYRRSSAFRTEIREMFVEGDDSEENPPVSLLRQAQDRLFFKGGKAALALSEANGLARVDTKTDGVAKERDYRGETSSPRNDAGSRGRTRGSAPAEERPDLAPIKAELCYLRNKLNEHLDRSRKKDWTARI